MGDGVNDVLALHEADVGISVNTAVEVAKDSSDIILLKKRFLYLKILMIWSSIERKLETLPILFWQIF
jgi:P-type E1-E2 ATPase